MTVVDVTWGNVSEAEAERLVQAAGMPHSLGEAGNTEPHITALVVALLKASGFRTVLETGAFQGSTSLALLEALDDLGGGVLTVCELDPDRADFVDRRLREANDLLTSEVHWAVRAEDALTVIRGLADQSLGVAWIDDDHQQAHVAEEIEALLPKMLPGGLLLFHDVHGVCDLKVVVEGYGGYALDFPRFGPAGGLGVIQVPR